MTVSRTVTEQIGRASWIRRMFEEGARLKAERGPDKVFDFTLGNPDLEPPEALIRTLREVVHANRPRSHAYMPNAGFLETREAIARNLSAATGLPYTTGHVVMTCGAAGAMNVVLRSILDRDDEVIVLAPYFAEYVFYTENHAGKVVVAETNEDCQPDVSRIADALTPRTRALIVNSPNNPSGVIYEEGFYRELESLLSRKGRDVIVLSDEPYKVLTFAGRRSLEVPPLVTNTVVANSWSKALAIPGERIGYLAVSPRIADAAALVDACVFANRVLGFVNAAAIWQIVVASADAIPVDPSPYERRCRRMEEALRAIGYEVIPPQAGFYVFAKTPVSDDVAFVHSLKDEGVLAVPGAGFGRGGYMRLSVTVPPATIEAALPGLERAYRRATSGVDLAPGRHRE